MHKLSIISGERRGSIGGRGEGQQLKEETSNEHVASRGEKRRWPYTEPQGITPILIQNHWVFDFTHDPEYSKYLENTTFRKLDLCLPSGEGMAIPALLGPLE
jgi:hypothetical protein